MNDAEVLAVTLEHVDAVRTLPFHHRDPFDRRIIAQPMVERAPIVTHDAAFAAYGVEIIRWRFAAGSADASRLRHLPCCLPLRGTASAPKDC